MKWFLKPFFRYTFKDELFFSSQFVQYNQDLCPGQCVIREIDGEKRSGGDSEERTNTTAPLRRYIQVTYAEGQAGQCSEAVHTEYFLYAFYTL